MTNVEIIKALKPGDWVFFNPCVFDSGGSYIRIVGVSHTETVLSFTYRQIDDGRDVAYTEWVAHQDDVGGDNTIYGLYIKVHTEEDIVNYISRCIHNAGANAWNMLKVLHHE